MATAAIVAGIGAYLEISGFDAASSVQPEAAMKALEQLFVLMPGVCFLLGVAVLCLYPLNKKRFNSLQFALVHKRKDEDYSKYQEDLDRIL